jgi:ABC-type cobalamin/Fe3+-siderophores transport system ATPase subunit
MKIRDIETSKRKIVIIGKNGSGKSMALTDLYNQNKEKNVLIPSARSVHSLDTNIQEIQNIERNVNSYINNRGYANQTDTLFISKLIGKEYEELRRKIGIEIATKDYIKLLNEILKKVSPDFHGIELKNFSLKCTDSYELKSSSDGEKHTIVMICAVLAAPESSVLLIDEPEIGIHTAALRALFDDLEERRPDCIFVYATHNVDFAKSREDATIVYASKKILKEIKDDDLDRDLLIDINGEPKPILLVEGNETDKKLYTKIFKKYEVRNGGGCGQIKNRVNAVREFFKREDVFGLVDGDNKNDEKNKSLKDQKCFSIPYAQHEHFYILPEVLQSYLEDNKTPESDIVTNATEILISVIKNAQDFSRYDQDKESDLAEIDKVKKLSKEITKDEILNFFKIYRGKDLIGKVEGKIKIWNIKQKILNNQKAVLLIDKHLDSVRNEINQIVFKLVA